MVTVLDGALGTELEARGVDTSGPAWSARALTTAPALVAAIHAEYAAAGATVHTAATFRTTARAYGVGWEEACALAVRLARGAVPPGQRIAGSLAPLEDCWHPERSPPDPGPAHALTARCLAEAGVDLILCETFAAVREALIAAEAALATGLPVWLSFTAGPRNDLVDPEAVRAAARSAASLGVERILVNCVPADAVQRWLDVIGPAGRPFGAYANAGSGDRRLDPERYAELASRWADAGATAIGGCCGTGPAHVRSLAVRLGCEDPTGPS